MGRSKQTGIGRSGEYFVAHLLELAGVEVYRVDGDCDLVANLGGELLRLEVKSASAVGTRGRYRFHIGARPNADFCAFVALDLALLRILNPSEIGKAEIKTLHPRRFTAANQADDILMLIENLKGRKPSTNPTAP